WIVCYHVAEWRVSHKASWGSASAEAMPHDVRGYSRWAVTPSAATLTSTSATHARAPRYSCSMTMPIKAATAGSTLTRMPNVRGDIRFKTINSSESGISVDNIDT